MTKRMSTSSAAVSVNRRAGAESAAVTGLGAPAHRASVTPDRRPTPIRPPIDRARAASMPWLLVLIVIGALVMAGVLIAVLARLVALPAAPSSVAPGPAPLSHSRRPPVETSETEDWSARPGPAYAR